MTDILKEIAAHKRTEIDELKASLPLNRIEQQLTHEDIHDFKAALSDESRINIIAELKKTSPSKGIMSPDFDPSELALKYKEGGASALSVLTDKKYFGGSFENLWTAKRHSGLSVLCKEFIIDIYQIYYARMMKADAVLLIVKLLNSTSLEEFLRLSTELGMATLVEVHDASEVKLAVDAGAGIIGVNNRNLDDFSVSLEVSEKLSDLIPNYIIKVTESGIFDIDDVRRLKSSGYNNFLVGEALVKAGNPTNLIKSLRKP